MSSDYKRRKISKEETGKFFGFAVGVVWQLLEIRKKGVCPRFVNFINRWEHLVPFPI